MISEVQKTNVKQAVIDINTYITTEIDSINAELARFNEGLPKYVTDTFEALKTKFEEKNKAKDDLNPYNN